MDGPTPDQAAGAAGAGSQIGSSRRLPQRALFNSRTASLNLTFAPHLPGDLTVTRFSGPAVKPLPVLRQASL